MVRSAGCEVRRAPAGREDFRFPFCVLHLPLNSLAMTISSPRLLIIAAISCCYVYYQQNVGFSSERLEPSARKRSQITSDEAPSACLLARRHVSNATMANISISDSIEFQMILFPPSKDKYISTNIRNKGAYEPEMGEFIDRALYRTASDTDTIWAVDIGANLGFHSLHMAKMGDNVHVIAFEPAPDTRALLECSVELLNGSGSITVIPAGAADVPMVGVLSRHPDSPGMTTFKTKSDIGFPVEKLESSELSKDNEYKDNIAREGGIQLVRVQDVLEAEGVPEGRSDNLRLLKLDAEGFEIKALEGLNLTRYPFKYFTFEFFPGMLKDSAGTDPVDLLLMIKEAGYTCENHNLNTREEIQTFASSLRGRHANLFCHLK